MQPRRTEHYSEDWELLEDVKYNYYAFENTHSEETVWESVSVNP